MKENRFIKIMLIIIGVLLSLNLIVLLLSNPKPSYAAKSIQYKVVRGEEVPEDEEIVEKLFNKYGEEGWEFVVQDPQWGFYIFKR
jgi:hypothetical protein